MAEKDLENIGDYIFYKLKAPKAAFDTVDGIRRSLDNLKVHPKADWVWRDILYKSGMGIIPDFFYGIEKSKILC